MFGCPTEKKEATAKLRMPAFLNSEAKGCDYIVLWLDCDKEGENICFEVLDSVAGAMKRLDKKTVFRAKFSSITDKDIVAAMNNLGEPLTEAEVKSMIAEADMDGDGKINFQEFSRLMANTGAGASGGTKESKGV